MMGWKKKTCVFIGIMLCLSVLTATCAAGERGDENREKTLEEMNLEELRSYQGFYYLSGGRDPMTMRFPTALEMGQDIRRGVGDGKPVPTLSEMEQKLSSTLAEIESAMGERDYVKALEVAEETIRIVDFEWPPLKADPPHLRRMDDQIRGYARLARNLKAREEIADEFAALPLVIQGVSWSPIGARAMINGRLMDAGEVMRELREQEDLRIESIEEHAVVFQFKGMRFRKPVELYSEGL